MKLCYEHKLRVQLSLRGVEIPDLVGSGQEVPGHVPGPSGSIDQIGSAPQGVAISARSVGGGLQAELQGHQLRSGGVGPGVLQGQDLRVVAVPARSPARPGWHRRWHGSRT